MDKQSILYLYIPSAPPSEPRDLKTTLASPNVVIVIWSPPINDGERNDVKYDVICRKCISGLCTVACNDVNFWPSNKDLTWSHVTMSSVSALVSYRVTVLAKNGVSDVAGLGYYANQSYVFTIPSLTTGTPTNVSSNFSKWQLIIVFNLGQSSTKSTQIV